MATNTDLERYRGDTVPDKITIKDSAGVVVDITGFTFKMSVDSTKDPGDEVTQLYKLTGLISIGTDGVVEFAPSAVQADQEPGTYYYDVEMTDAALQIQTILVGKYKYRQDYTKT